MYYFKDEAGALHALEDLVHVDLLPASSVEISEEEFVSATTPPPNPNAEILARISELELTVTPRRMREATLGTDNGWLADLDSQIAALRRQLT